MPLAFLDHVNIQTANLKEMSRFYEVALGLVKGPRPPFRGFDGAWHYCDDKAAIHLVEVKRPRDPKSLQIEHFAFRGENMNSFLSNLRDMKVAYNISIIPEVKIRQVNIHDPDGNHIEIQFAPSEVGDISNFNA